jgi:hypothetical protein
VHGDISPYNTVEVQTAVKRKKEKQKPLGVCAHMRITYYGQHVGGIDKKAQLLQCGGEEINGK